MASLDNITYILQKKNKGTKPKTDAEMLALQDEMNRQYKRLGVQTRAVYFPNADEYDPKYLDYTDNTVVVGDAGAQENYIKKKFPYSWSNIKGWGSNVGENSNYGFAKGAYGLVDDRGAKYVSDISNNKISLLQALAALAIHEDTHPYYSAKHITDGIFEEGQTAANRIKNGMTVDEWVSPEKAGNKKYRGVIINTRQYGKENRKSKDNYALNKRLMDAEEYKKPFNVNTLSINNPYE